MHSECLNKRYITQLREKNYQAGVMCISERESRAADILNLLFDIYI